MSSLLREKGIIQQLYVLLVTVKGSKRLPGVLIFSIEGEKKQQEVFVLGTKKGGASFKKLKCACFQSF